MSSYLQLLKEFRPALRFLAIFVSIYLFGNILYGLWIESLNPHADPMTVMAARQTVYLLNLFSEPASITISQSMPIVHLMRFDKSVLRAFEGCNGINVMIVFIAFLFAFKGTWKRLLLFAGAGLLVIHVANLVRLGLLYYTAVYRPHYFYYFHKYLFTAMLYAVVFVLWYIWMNQSGPKATALATYKK